MEPLELEEFYKEYKHYLLLMFSDITHSAVNEKTNDILLKHHFMLEHGLKKFIDKKECFKVFESSREFRKVFKPLIKEFKLHREKYGYQIGELKVPVNAYNRLNLLVNRFNEGFLLKPKL